MKLIRCNGRTGSGASTAPRTNKYAGIRIRPFELHLQIETIEDLAGMWARFNMHGDTLADAAGRKAARGKKGSFHPDFLDLLNRNPEGKKEIWRALNEKMKEFGISPR